ncbi:DUF2591 domain-containing protein [Aestuariibacter halophilus]|uniref:DUF2591 domain-containing protein n=1 Tax=Fluctibacter halophilus TaxID=226011 RepID=A0ABS8G5U6_9ALTE|nr:phage protein NinX family protein [Aestuariibacter halophilus]MCC2615982.1 DUF2591 domain-containing protein [Aestuariibacter halophilus]
MTNEDYHSMSDSEINGLVFVKSNPKFEFAEYNEEHDELYWCDAAGQNDFTFKTPCYCNNPSDAWPIIVENKISIWSQGSNSKLWCAFWHSEEGLRHVSTNPLRAAMIVYLMMQEKPSDHN